MPDLNPTVSVVIPTKNRRHVLPETIASIQAQTFPGWEVLVVDDASTDDTEAMVQALASDDPRIRFIPRGREPAGAPTCRNIGLSEARGEFVLFLDSDDLLAPTCLEHRVRQLKQNPTLAFVVSSGERFKTIPGDLGIAFGGGDEQYDFWRALCMHYPWQTAAPLWRKPVVRQIGAWDESLKIGQDLDLTTRALILGLPYRRLPIRDYYYRENPSGIGLRLWNLESQPSHIRRTDNARECLASQGRLHGFARTCIAGNYLWIAQNMVSLGHPHEARQIWDRARKLKVVPWYIYFICRLLLRPTHARGRRLLAPILILILPRGLLVRPSSSQMSERFVDRKGRYRPVHYPDGVEDCLEAGTFVNRRWVNAYIDRFQGRAHHSPEVLKDDKRV
jgi:glycosyltransferase involved in cell wall biosynthesis